MDKPSFQMSADARLLYQHMKKANVGDTIALTDLTGEVSRPLSEIRGAIQTALRRLLKDDGRVFASVRGVGYLRLDDSGIVDGATADTVAIRRRAKRGVEKLSKVSNFAALPQAKQLEHNTRMSVLGVIASMTREPAVERVRQAAQGRASELPMAETIRAFLNDPR